MLKYLLPGSLFLTSLCLSGCILMKQDETYTQSEICEGLKRQMVFNTISPNITSDTLKNSPARLRELWRENNCE